MDTYVAFYDHYYRSGPSFIQFEAASFEEAVKYSFIQAFGDDSWEAVSVYTQLGTLYEMACMAAADLDGVYGLHKVEK